MTDLASCSYKELQALAKANGISARQKSVDLIAALTPILGVSSSSTAAVDSSASAPMEVDEEEPKKRTRGRPKKGTVQVPVEEEEEEQQHEDENASVSVASGATRRKRTSADAQLEETNQTTTTTTTQQQPTRKSKKSAASPIVPTPAPDDDPDDPTPIVKERVTRRGRRAKRVNSSEGPIESETESIHSRRTSQVESITIPAGVETSAPSSRRGSQVAPPAAAANHSSSRKTNSPIVTPHIGTHPTITSPVRARPSIAGSSRKRWSRLPVELFGGGGVLLPPVPTTTATTGIFGGRGSGGHPAAAAPAHLRQSYAARHSLSSNGNSPQKRSGSALLAAARRMSGGSSGPSPSQPTTPKQIAAYSPIVRESPRSNTFPPAAPSLQTQQQRRSSLQSLTSPRAIVPPARNPDQLASRLSFSKFPGPGQATVVPGAFDPSSTVGSIGGAFTVGTNNRPQARGKPGARVLAAAANATANKANSGTIFASKSRPTTTTRLPAGSPARTSLAPRPQASPSAAAPAVSSTPARAPTATRAKFDLAASLQRPVGWAMKKGALKPASNATSVGVGGGAAGSVPTLPTGVTTTNPIRTTQLKTNTFVNNRTSRQQVAQEKTQAARQNKLAQARGSRRV